MPALVPRYTVEDLEAFPQDGNRYELLDGVLLVTPGPAFSHERVVIRLRDRLIGYLGDRALVCGTGVVQVGPANLLQPDILVIPAARPSPRRWNDLRDWWLAVEVSGRGSRVYDRDFKHRAYRLLGVREVWRVDLGSRTVEVTRPGTVDVTVVADRLEWRGPGCPGPLSIDVPDLFEDIDPDD